MRTRASLVKPLHLPLHHLVKDVVDRRMRRAEGALRRAHLLQPVRRDHLIHARGDLARRDGRLRLAAAALAAVGVEQPLGSRERLGDAARLARREMLHHERARLRPHPLGVLAVRRVEPLGAAAVEHTLEQPHGARQAAHRLRRPPEPRREARTRDPRLRRQLGRLRGLRGTLRQGTAGRWVSAQGARGRRVGRFVLLTVRADRGRQGPAAAARALSPRSRALSPRSHYRTGPRQRGRAAAAARACSRSSCIHRTNASRSACSAAST
eukprot:6993344-Prymnesium_polylepis.1